MIDFKKIFWIASYPKSGNTWLRLILCGIFYTKDGNLENLKILENIPKFDTFDNFKFINNISLSDFKKIFHHNKYNEEAQLTLAKYWLEAQKKIKMNNKNFNFFKTHNARLKFREYYYTNEQTSLGFIYIARDPRDCVSFDGKVEVTAAPAEFTSETVALYGAMVRSAQMAGALERIIEDTLQYTTDRTQFGKPIGKFQVIQQNMAMAAAEVAAAGMAAQNAFRAAEQGLPDFEAACAKVLAGEAAGMATDICHETHGAIGFTYEHHLHFFTRRLWSWRGEFGAESEWAEQLGRRAAARGADALWSDITERQSANA